MSQIILDASVSNQLHNLTHSVELCDPLGRVLGRFVPVLAPSQHELVEPPISVEELQRRRQEPDYSTAEVLAYLEKL